MWQDSLRWKFTVQVGQARLVFLSLTPSQKVDAQARDEESTEAWEDRLRALIFAPDPLIDFLDETGKRPADLPTDWREQIVPMMHTWDIQGLYTELAFRPATAPGVDRREGYRRLAARLGSESQGSETTSEPEGLSGGQSATVPMGDQAADTNGGGIAVSA